jgi:hypothetical protein
VARTAKRPFRCRPQPKRLLSPATRTVSDRLRRMKCGRRGEGPLARGRERRRRLGGVLIAARAEAKGRPPSRLSDIAGCRASAPASAAADIIARRTGRYTAPVRPRE